MWATCFTSDCAAAEVHALPHTCVAEHVLGPCTVAAAPSLANRYLLPRPTLRIFTRFWGVRLKHVSGSHVVNSLTVRLTNTKIFFELIQPTRSCLVEASSVIRGSLPVSLFQNKGFKRKKKRLDTAQSQELQNFPCYNVLGWLIPRTDMRSVHPIWRLAHPIKTNPTWNWLLFSQCRKQQ